MHYKANILAAVTTFLWAGCTLFERRGLSVAGPYGFSLVYTATTVLVCCIDAPVLFYLMQRTNEINPRESLRWAMATTLCAAIAAVTYAWALKYGRASVVTVIASSYPVIVALILMTFGNEPFSWRVLIGAVVVATGLGIVSI